MAEYPNAPPRSNNQSFPIDYVTRNWWASPPGSNPPGYVYDMPKDGTPTPAPAPSPYDGDGLIAVIEEVGQPPLSTNAAAALAAKLGAGAAEFFNATAQQDGTWNAAVGMVCNGIDPAVAYQNVSRPGQAPVGGMLFDEAKLLAAVPVIDSYR